MKILNIHFKNINSLEGESRIDFERAPFTDTGVFAITGPNGSGKSSILDAITLGLYGETFRFDRPANHVMTQHTGECFSAVEFVLDNEKYRSSWHVKRIDAKPEAELTLPEMKLTRLGDQEVLATTSQQVCAQITDITGMNFRNFTRSILLAQGDFSAFLNALDSERMNILEKIISADIYTDYKNEVNKKATDAQQTLDFLKQDLSVIPAIEPEKLEALEHDLADFIEQTSELREEQNTLKQQQTSLQNVFVLQNLITDQENALQSTKALRITTQQKLGHLVTAQDALQYTDDVQTIKEKKHGLHQNKETLASFKDELQHIQDLIGSDKTPPHPLQHKLFADQEQKIKGLRAQIGLLTNQRQSESELWQSLCLQVDEKTATLANVTAWLEAHATDASLLTGFPETVRLKNLRAEFQALTEKQKAFSKWSKSTAASLKNNQSAIDQENKRIAQLKLKLPLAESELDELTQGKNLEELEEFRLEQQDRVKDFRELFNLAHTNKKLSQTGFYFFGIFKSKEPVQQDFMQLESELDALKREINREENIKAVLETAVFRESLLKKMAGDRQHLANGQPCYLCGSLDHPYAAHPPKTANSQQALTDQKLKIRTLKVAGSKLAQQIKLARKQAEKDQLNLTAMLKTKSQWQTLCNRLNTASEELSIHKLRLMKHRLNHETEALKTITSVVAGYRKKQAGIELLRAMIAKGEATIQRLQLSTQQLESEWQTRPQDGVDYPAALATLQQEEQQLADKILGQLTLLGEKMPAKGKEDALYDRLNARRQEYQTHVLRRKNLIEELEYLRAKAEQCHVEIRACNEKLDRFNQQLHNEEIIGLHLALIEKQKLIADQERHIAGLETELAALKQTLQHKLLDTQFSNLHELTEMLELLQHQPELERQLAELEQEIDARTIELDKNHLELDANRDGLITGLSLEQLNAQLKTVTEKREIADLEAKRLERLLGEQEHYQQKAGLIRAQLQDQETIARQCIAEANQIAQESGMAFRRRVQKWVAERLLSQTNTVLEKISGRYYLRSVPSEMGLALNIEDTFQGNVLRLPKTLSGGESFVVSLALALGLSELANNGKSVDSLFLDEGFGNLDAETLYTVISTLESLHTHGKTVGVISHIEGVQKRFKAQLQVVKKPNGMGMLKQVS